MVRRKASQSEIDSLLTQLDGWMVQNGKLHKKYKFNSFAEAIGWMMSVAIYAEKIDHHPEWLNIYNRVIVDLVTHDMGNVISTFDLRLATQMESLILEPKGQKPSKEKAGIVPYRITSKNAIEILLITTRTRPKSWIFPVGTVDAGETLVKAAIRECEEESGYTVAIGSELGNVTLQRNKTIQQFTFFLGKVKGEVKTWENDRKRKWFPLEKITQKVPLVFQPIAENTMAYFASNPELL